MLTSYWISHESSMEKNIQKFWKTVKVEISEDIINRIAKTYTFRKSVVWKDEKNCKVAK